MTLITIDILLNKNTIKHIIYRLVLIKYELLYCYNFYSNITKIPYFCTTIFFHKINLPVLSCMLFLMITLLPFDLFHENDFYASKNFVEGRIALSPYSQDGMLCTLARSR